MGTKEDKRAYTDVVQHIPALGKSLGELGNVRNFDGPHNCGGCDAGMTILFEESPRSQKKPHR